MKYINSKKTKIIVKSVFGLLLYLIIQMIIQLTSFILFVNKKDRNMVGIEQFLSNHILILTIVSNFITIIILSFYFRIKKKRLLKEADVLKVSYRFYLLPLICSFSFSMFMNLFTYGIEFSNHSMIMQSMAYYSSQLSGSGNILIIVCLLFAAPLCEEIIFRGLIMKTNASLFAGNVYFNQLSALWLDAFDGWWIFVMPF